MKHSVVIIAHNEELHIEQCIESLLHQTIKPDEILVVIHNSTDRTHEITGGYPVKRIVLDGPTGTAYARMKGIEEAGGEIILCIDGDCFAEEHWVSVLSEVLDDRTIMLAGSWIAFKGIFINGILNIINKYACIVDPRRASHWLWGASFAFHKDQKSHVLEYLQKGLEFSNELKLSRNPDDYWLALLMMSHGKIIITNKTFVTHYQKELTINAFLARNKENRRNGKIIRQYIKAVSIN